MVAEIPHMMMQAQIEHYPLQHVVMQAYMQKRWNDDVTQSTS